MRLFAALSLSPEAIDRLTRLRLRLSAPNDGLRWSTPEQWHITLQFYGDVGADRAVCLAQALAQGTYPARPEIALEGWGRFTAKGILYAAVAVSPALDQLQGAVAAASQVCGFLPEFRPFRPHVTLARSKGQKGVSTFRESAVSALPAFGPKIQWIAQEILLLRSILNPHGAEYTVEKRVRLPG